MERKNNYEIQAGQARKLFCAHDLDAVARAHGLRTDGDFLYLRLLSEDYRVSRADGYIARRDSGAWLPADGFDETLTIFDLLCDAKPGRRAAGAWKTTLDFGGQVHRGLMEPNRADALELLYDRRPELLERACLRLGGTPMAGADVSFSLPFFEELRIAVQFWSCCTTGGRSCWSAPACASCGTRTRISICAMRRCIMPSACSNPACGHMAGNKKQRVCSPCIHAGSHV